MSKIFLILLVVFLAIIFLGPFALSETFSGYVAEMFVLLSSMPLMFLFRWIARKTRRRFATNTKASTEELRREDDVLLQSTALSQSIFFIYLNLISSSRIIEILKWTVPIVTIFFYGMRAYSKVKDSAKYRYYSILVLVLIMIQISGFAFLQIIPAVYIEKHDVTTFYVPFVLGGFFIIFLEGISDALRRRYGYI